MYPTDINQDKVLQIACQTYSRSNSSTRESQIQCSMINDYARYRMHFPLYRLAIAALGHMNANEVNCSCLSYICTAIYNNIIAPSHIRSKESTWIYCIYDYPLNRKFLK